MAFHIVVEKMPSKAPKEKMSQLDGSSDIGSLYAFTRVGTAAIVSASTAKTTARRGCLVSCQDAMAKIAKARHVHSSQPYFA